MALTIYKYQVQLDVPTVVALPKDARVIRFGMQRGLLWLWALIDPAAPLVERAFHVYGTGASIPNNATYLGSTDDPPYVWHLFQLPS